MFRGAAKQPGHLLTVNWAASGVDLVGQVSLFNSVTYAVSLASGYKGAVWRPVRSGLHFNLQTRTVEPLLAVSSIRAAVRTKTPVGALNNHGPARRRRRLMISTEERISALQNA